MRHNDDAPAPKKNSRKKKPVETQRGTTKVVAITISPDALADVFTPGGWIRVTSGLPKGCRFIGSDTVSYLGRKSLKFFFAVPPISDPLVVQRGMSPDDIIIKLESRVFDDTKE